MASQTHTGTSFKYYFNVGKTPKFPEEDMTFVLLDMCQKTLNIICCQAT